MSATLLTLVALGSISIVVAVRSWGACGACSWPPRAAADLEAGEGGRSVLARSRAAINAVIVHGVAPVLGNEGVPTLGSTAIMRDGENSRQSCPRTVVCRVFEAWADTCWRAPRPGLVPQAL